MKTKIIVTMMVAVMAMAAITGCGEEVSAMDSTENVEISDSIFEGSEDEIEDEIAGGWSASESSAITDEVKSIFDKATKNLTGVDYQPVAYLGSQVVAGMNHAILCKATTVVPKAKPYYTIMYIYEDLEGNATIQEFSDIELGWN